MADVKSLLKEARKLIDEKKFKEAQDCCKSLLRQDKRNYLGLVLLGKSLQNDEQAPLAFQKAISCKPDNPLAWQGLAYYYENQESDNAKIKLLSVYEEMLKLTFEDDKLIDIIHKIVPLGSSTKSPLATSTLIKFITSTSKNNLGKEAGKALISLLKSDVPYNKDIDKGMFIKILNDIYEDDPGNSFIEMTIVQTIASENMSTTAIVREIINLSFFATSKSIRQWLCKYLFINYVEKGDNIVELETIIKDIDDYKYAGLLKSASLYEQGNYLDAFKMSVSLVDYTHPEKHESVFIIRCTVYLKKWTVTEKLAKTFLNTVTDKEFQKELRKYLFLALTKQLKWKQAYCIAVQGLDVESIPIEHKALLAECYIEMNQSVDEIMNNLINSDYYVPLMALRLIEMGEFNKAVTLLEDNLSKVNNGSTYYYLALAYWEIKLYDKVHINLLKAAKLDSDCPYIFLYLGHYYKECSNDLEKARKCYEKANNILPFNDIITMNLSEIYVKLGLEDLHYQLLITLEQSELKNSVWLNYRLGLHYLNNRDCENAILKFRNVIKANPRDAIAFECLADAYFSRGSYTSALKAYNKTITLSPNKASHCLTNIGNIHKLLTQYSEAIDTFKKVLIIDPESVLALKGISETWMKIAEKKFSSNLYGSARDSIQNAINYMIKTISVGKQMSSLYKMLGDALMFVTTLPSSYSFVYINGLFHEAKEQKKIDKLNIFTYVIACYMKVNELRNQTSSFDLAPAYLSWYRQSNKQLHLQVALNLAIDRVRKKCSNYQNWNLLGKIFYYLKKYHLAQHCFIKAISLTQKLPIAKVWCNLGTLYLKLKLNMIANFCYWRGQSALPSYPHSWIGQALIAERIRESDAMDLFRHASRLGYHPESVLAYSDWVCRKLKTGNSNNPEFEYEIYGLHAIPYSTDLMQWFCTFEENNACGHTILGILQERLGLLKSAKQSYEIALQHAKDGEKNIVLLNLGRIYLRLKEYEEAITAHRAITEASLNSLCGLALSLFKNGSYEEAYSTYDMALHWVTENAQHKLEIMVALASIMYVFKGPDEAKMLLFQSIRLSQNQPSPYCLFASCSLGILHSEDNLSKLALRALQKHETDPKYACDIGFLKSYMCIYENRIEDAIRSISDTVNDFPSHASLWFYLAQYSLMLSKAKWASACAQKAMSIACSQSVLDANSPKMFATASICEFIAGNQTQAIHIAKRAMHMYPYESEIWAALIYSLLSKDVIVKSDKRHWLISAANHLGHLSTHSSLSKWAGHVERTLLI